MTLAIIGSRTVTDYSLLCDHMRTWIWHEGSECPITKVVSGGAAGADSLGGRWARDHKVELVEYLPEWEKHGKRAGFIRNEAIIRAADVVLALWDGTSRGTAHSLSVAKRLKKTTLIVYC